jgi:hypothetical protein
LSLVRQYDYLIGDTGCRWCFVVVFVKRLTVSDNFSILASNFAVIASASSERFVDVTIIVRYLVGDKDGFTVLLLLVFCLEFWYWPFVLLLFWSRVELNHMIVVGFCVIIDRNLFCVHWMLYLWLRHLNHVPPIKALYLHWDSIYRNLDITVYFFETHLAEAISPPKWCLTEGKFHRKDVSPKVYFIKFISPNRPFRWIPFRQMDISPKNGSD